jgi:hypothetical protein
MAVTQASQNNIQEEIKRKRFRECLLSFDSGFFVPYLLSRILKDLVKQSHYRPGWALGVPEG